ncbi:hypothetical protein KW798_02055, partial [Candidatus Parcubacteria bacterium]|nr:hypothetical protein [Candidatus Parcubacteria bacterium]
LDVSTAGGASAFHVTAGGRVGIGTSSPFATLSVIATSTATNPAFVVATSSTWSTDSGQQPLIYITATTTGTMDFARVAIGTTTTFGAGGLRDQFTVAGRIYSTWRYSSCDFGSTLISDIAVGTAAFATTNNVCGDFSFSGIDARLRNATTTSFAIPWTRIEAGSSGVTAGDAAAVTMGVTTIASTSPVFEAMVVIPSAPGGIAPSGAGTSTNFMVGLIASTSATGVANIYARQDYPGFYFQATSTNYWNAIARGVNGTTTVPLTTFATGTPARLRVEVTPAGATYLINGNVVATIATTGIAMPLAPAITAGATFATGNPRRIDFSYIRFWSDDPAGDIEVAGVWDDAPSADPMPDRIQGADISLAQYVNDTSQFLQGLLVANATSSGQEMIRLSKYKYDSDLSGVVSTSHRTVMGQEASSTVRVATGGRAPVIVSLENGPIKKGDRITASSLMGIGMRAGRVGEIVGTAIDTFASTTEVNGAELPSCDEILKKQLTDAGIVVPDNACLATVLVTLNVGANINTGNIFQDAGSNIIDLTSALAELSNDAFTKGAELTKFVVGQIVAKVAVIGDLFAQTITTGDLTVGTASQPAGITLFDQTTHAPYCVQMQSGQLVSVAGECGKASTSTPEVSTPVESNEIPTDEPTDENASSTPPVTPTPDPIVEDNASSTPPITISEPPAETSPADEPAAETPADSPAASETPASDPAPSASDTSSDPSNG